MKHAHRKKPELAAQQAAKIRKLRADPDSSYNQSEFREKVRVNMHKIWSGDTGERRASMSEARKRWWAETDGAEYDPHNVDPRTDHQRWAWKVKMRDDWVCQECGATERLHAHHIKHVRSFPELAEDVSNGITLCEVCYAKKYPHVAMMRAILIENGLCTTPPA